MTEDPRTAGVQLGQAEQPLDQGRLAGAVGAEHGDDLTAADGEVEVADDRAVLVAEGGALELDDGGCSGHEQSCPSRTVSRLLRMTET